MEPFTPGAGGAIPPRRRICFFFLFCVRPFGAIYPRASGFVLFFFYVFFFFAHLEPFTPGAGGAIPPRRRLCVFFLFCVRPLGAIYPRAGGFVLF